MADKTDKKNDQQVTELEEKKQEKKPNLFVRGWRRVKSIGRGMRDNPVVAAAGAAIGAALALGGKAFVDWKLSKSCEEGPLEVEDTGEEYIEEEPEEEVQEDDE